MEVVDVTINYERIYDDNKLSSWKSLFILGMWKEVSQKRPRDDVLECFYNAKTTTNLMNGIHNNVHRTTSLHNHGSLRT